MGQGTNRHPTLYCTYVHYPRNKYSVSRMRKTGKAKKAHCGHGRSAIGSGPGLPLGQVALRLSRAPVRRGACSGGGCRWLSGGRGWCLRLEPPQNLQDAALIQGHDHQVLRA